MVNPIFLITLFVEQRKSGFGVARLMMMSGVNVRTFRPEDPESQEAFERVHQVLPELFSAQELQELERFLAEERRR